MSVNNYARGITSVYHFNGGAHQICIPKKGSITVSFLIHVFMITRNWQLQPIQAICTLKVTPSHFVVVVYVYILIAPIYFKNIYFT